MNRSKMSENEKPSSNEEKLNQSEFRQLIPHLEWNQLFLIEIQLSEKWQYLFDAHYENKALMKLTCTACSEDVNLEGFEKHIHSTTHLAALEKVETFYHPLFTSDQKNLVSKGASDTSEDATERNMQKANAIAAKIELVKRTQSYKSKTFSAKVTLPLVILMTVEFRRKEGLTWQPLLKTGGTPHASSDYTCMLCVSKVCKGVNSLNQHLNGNTHRHLQLKVHEVRVPKYEQLTKYCLYSSNREQSYTFNLLKLEEEGSNSAEEKKNLSKKDLKNGLVGVEYVAQIERDSQPGSYLYACCLCDIEIMTSAEIMENHLISFDHRKAYCDLYYGDTIGNFKRMISDCRAHYPNVMPFVLEKIALGIDQYHGFGTPTLTTESHFRKSRKDFAEKLRGLPHACQEYGPSFSNVVNAQEIRDYKKNPLKEQLEAEADTPVRFTVKDPKKPYLHMRRHVSRPIKKLFEELEKGRHSKTPSVRREKYSKKRSRSPSHEYVERKQRTASRHKESCGASDIWSVYRDLISKGAVELESMYVGYRKQPEKHPLYDQEWNTFWRRRKEELMLEGKNYRSYNFQPEWTTYFRQRLEQMFGEDLQKSKLDVRHRLNIPINAEEDSLPTDAIGYAVAKTYSENMWDKTYIPHRAEEQLQVVPAPKKVDKPTVIHMLRLMTALEDHLGNLGTKVLELLTKAVSLEKFYPADSADLEKQILTPSNYKLLKIAAEKLKSKLYADLIEGNKVNSFKRVIECSEVILKKAEMMGWANESELPIDHENTQIKKLIEVLQEKKDASPSINKKSLSDALMEVISQKKLKGTPTSFDSLMEQTQMREQNNSFANNIPSNYYSDDMPTQSLSYNSRNIRADPNNRNHASAHVRGDSIHFNSQYGRNSFGNVNMQWPNANSRFSYPPNNYGPNSGFVNIYPNGPNNGNWKS